MKKLWSDENHPDVKELVEVVMLVIKVGSRKYGSLNFCQGIPDNYVTLLLLVFFIPVEPI